MYVCMYVCMHGCMYAYIYIYLYIYIYTYGLPHNDKCSTSVVSIFLGYSEVDILITLCTILSFKHLPEWLAKAILLLSEYLPFLYIVSKYVPFVSLYVFPSFAGSSWIQLCISLPSLLFPSVCLGTLPGTFLPFFLFKFYEFFQFLAGPVFFISVCTAFMTSCSRYSIYRPHHKVHGMLSKYSLVCFYGNFWLRLSVCLVCYCFKAKLTIRSVLFSCFRYYVMVDFHVLFSCFKYICVYCSINPTCLK